MRAIPPVGERFWSLRCSGRSLSFNRRRNLARRYSVFLGIQSPTVSCWERSPFCYSILLFMIVSIHRYTECKVRVAQRVFSGDRQTGKSMFVAVAKTTLHRAIIKILPSLPNALTCRYTAAIPTAVTASHVVSPVRTVSGTNLNICGPFSGLGTRRWFQNEVCAWSRVGSLDRGFRVRLLVH